MSRRRRKEGSPKLVDERAMAGANDRCMSVGELAKLPGSKSATRRVWERFQNDRELARAHKVSAREIKLLSQVSLLGEPKNSSDFLLVLKILRAASKS